MLLENIKAMKLKFNGKWKSVIPRLRHILSKRVRAKDEI